MSQIRLQSPVINRIYQTVWSASYQWFCYSDWETYYCQMLKALTAIICKTRASSFMLSNFKNRNATEVIQWLLTNKCHLSGLDYFVSRYLKLKKSYYPFKLIHKPKFFINSLRSFGVCNVWPQKLTSLCLNFIMSSSFLWTSSTVQLFDFGISDIYEIICNSQ